MTTSNEQLPPADEGRRSSEGLGAFFSERAVRDAVMTAAEEAKVLKRECPKCGDMLARLPDGGRLKFWHCIGCGCMFCVDSEAPNAKLNGGPPGPSV